jgi:crotonobetainyl-CoA:carnitine CoA-transferase CaiB-like acyl-CoA transferase
VNASALRSTWLAIGGDEAALDHAHVTGSDPVLPSTFRIGTAAAAAIGASSLAAAELFAARTGRQQEMTVDTRHAAVAFRSERHVRVDGNALGEIWSPFSRFYRSADGRYIQLHTNFPHHLERALAVLGAPADVNKIAAAVARGESAELDDSLAAAGACAAMSRTAAEWHAHPQGAAVRSLPLLDATRIGDSDIEPLAPADRPLAGVRVLDLTRVLAGPVCARTLAAHGAEVTRVIAASLPEIDAALPDTALGKTTQLLDLRVADDAARLHALVRDADMFLQSYRPGALDRLGFGVDELTALRPGLVYVSLSAYGHTGPWCERRGYDSLVQTASGIAREQAEAMGSEQPRHLPAAAHDHATGYLAAAAAVLALRARHGDGGSRHIRCSLAQTREWLDGLGRVDGPDVTVPSQDDVADLLEDPRTPTDASRTCGPRASSRRLPRTGDGYDTGSSNQVHCHGVIVSNGPANEGVERSRSIGAIAAATATGSSSSHATVIRSSPGCHGCDSDAAPEPNDQSPATPGTLISAASWAAESGAPAASTTT